MDCQDAAVKLQELLDGALDQRETAVARRHLESCPACSRIFRTLALAAEGLAALPVRRPSPALRAKVLAELARQRRAPLWTACISAPALALAASGMAVAGLVSGRILSLGRLLAAWNIVSDPDQAVAMLKLELARGVLVAGRLWGEAAVWLPSVRISSFFPAQLALAMLLAGGIIAVTVRGTARPAWSTHWRPL